MKKDIHPVYQDKATVTCACGTKFSVGSTASALQVEICSACHPFYTGKQNLIDTTGRVERFKTRSAKQTVAAAGRKGKTVKRQTRVKKTPKVEIETLESIKAVKTTKKDLKK